MYQTYVPVVRQSTLPCPAEDPYGPSSLPTPMPPPPRRVTGSYSLVAELNKVDLVEENERLRALLVQVLGAQLADMPALLAAIRETVQR